jgi:hypothetical protein
MELRPGSEWQQRPDRAREDNEQQGAHHDHSQRRARGHVPAAGPYRPAQVLARQRVGRAGRAPRRDHRDDREVGRRVDEEDRSRAGGRQDDAADGRACRAGQVLVHRSQRDRLLPLRWVNQFRLQRLPGRRGQRRPGAKGEGQREQDPRGDESGQGECPERRRRDQREPLCDEQEAAAVHQVTDGTRQHREQHDWQAAGRRDERHVGRGAGHRQHQPLRADRLHPAADIADELGGPHRREQPVPERCPGGVVGGRRVISSHLLLIAS